jgi:hypothetical protein
VALAILNAAGQVVTFVRDDVPETWAPPEGFSAVPESQLPANWEHAPDTSPVPESITARQIRLWMIRHGMSLADVDAAIDTITDPITRESVRVEWAYAPYVLRSHEWLVPLAQSLGLTAAQVDAAFREAATI